MKSLATLAILSVVTAQQQSASIESILESYINKVIPGGLGSLGALGISIPTIPSSISGYITPYLSTPLVTSTVSNVLNGQLPSIPTNLNINNITDLIPPACQQAIYNATSTRNDCGPLYNILYSNSARQNQTAVADVCSSDNSGCLQAVEQAVADNQQICESYIDYGIPGISTYDINYLSLILSSGCTQAVINGTQQYCLPTWDSAATDIASNGLSNSSVHNLCQSDCRNALTSSLVHNNQYNASAPTSVSYSNILNAACAVNPATAEYCVAEIGSVGSGTSFGMDVSKFCTPCARIEMALGQQFTYVSQSTYNHVVEQIEAYACASDASTGDLCSDVIYNQAISSYSDLAVFYNNQTLLESCGLSIVLQGQCPSECSEPLQSFVNSLGSCGGLLVSNETLSYASYLPAPYNALLPTVFQSCGLHAAGTPQLAGTVIAEIYSSNVTESGRLNTLLTGNYSNDDILSALHYPYATVSKAGNQYNFTGDSGLSVGLIAQRITNSIYQGRFGNESTVSIVPLIPSNTSSSTITASNVAHKLASGRWLF